MDVERTSVREGEPHVAKIHPRVRCRRGARHSRTDADHRQRHVVRQWLVRLPRLQSSLELALPPPLLGLLQAAFLLWRQVRRLEEVLQILLSRTSGRLHRAGNRATPASEPGFARFHIDREHHRHRRHPRDGDPDQPATRQFELRFLRKVGQDRSRRPAQDRMSATKKGTEGELPMTTIIRIVALCAALLAAGSAFDDQYPNKPVKIIVPFPPAGQTDIAGRLIAQKLSDRLGQQFYIENISGAGGNLGMGNVARAVPDGYTILFASSSIVVNPSLYPKIPYDPYKDFQPVSVPATAPNILLVNPSVPAKDVKELVAYIKANPGKISYASAGTGTTPHLSSELLKLTLNLDIVHVPFGGAGPAIQSLVAGHTPMGFTSMPPAVPLIKEGKLRALAVAAPKRSAALPDVPTLDELGFKEQEADTFQGVLLPAGTPKPIVDLLYKEIVAIVALPDVKDRFAQLGLEIIANTPDEFAAQIKREIEKWGRVIREANIKAE